MIISVSLFCTTILCWAYSFPSSIVFIKKSCCVSCGTCEVNRSKISWLSENNKFLALTFWKHFCECWRKTKRQQHSKILCRPFCHVFYGSSLLHRNWFSLHLFCLLSVLKSGCLTNAIFRVWPAVPSSPVCFSSSHTVIYNESLH